jgi:hypothetical protein
METMMGIGEFLGIESALSVVVMLGVGCCLYLQYRERLWLKRHGNMALGKIIGIKREEDDGSTVWLAIVEFTDKTGMQHRFNANMCHGRSSWIVNQQVEIRYHPDNPNKAIVV